MKRIILFGLLAGLLTSSTGCGLYQAIFCYRPCDVRGGGGAYVSDECDDDCGATCGQRPVRVARRAVVADCDEGCGGTVAKPCRKANCTSCDPCSDPCGTGTYGRPWHRGPLSCLFALFTPNTWCGSACGERYWGDFYSDPPDCNDPCDGCGNYTGGNTASGGCRSCGGGHARGSRNVYTDDGSEVTQEDNLVPQAERVVTPTPAKSNSVPHKAVKQ